MPTPDPNAYAEDWVRAWNAHDIEAVLRHFRDDVVFTSPVAARVVPETEGVVREGHGTYLSERVRRGNPR